MSVTEKWVCWALCIGVAVILSYGKVLPMILYAFLVFVAPFIGVYYLGVLYMRLMFPEDFRKAPPDPAKNPKHLAA